MEITCKHLLQSHKWLFAQIDHIHVLLFHSVNLLHFIPCHKHSSIPLKTSRNSFTLTQFFSCRQHSALFLNIYINSASVWYLPLATWQCHWCRHCQSLAATLSLCAINTGSSFWSQQKLLHIDVGISYHNVRHCC